MKHRILKERVFPYTREQVWEALTNPEYLSEWLMPTDFQPFVGHKFQFRTAPSMGFDGIVNCEVLLINEPNKLSYTWQGGPMKQPTVVTWTLDSVTDGTKITLKHDGFDGIKVYAVGVLLGMGWGKILNKRLPSVLEEKFDKQTQASDT